MVWNIIEYQWNTIYAQAKAYYEQYGSLSIPDEREAEYKQLRTWIQEQKLKYNMKDRHNLSKEQVEQLEEIGVIQEDRTEQEESLEELEGKLQGLVEKKKASSQLVSDFERVKKLKSANKGVEK